MLRFKPIIQEVQQINTASGWYILASSPMIKLMLPFFRESDCQQAVVTSLEADE